MSSQKKRGRPANDITHLDLTQQIRIVRHRSRMRSRYYDPNRDPIDHWARIGIKAARKRAADISVPFDLTVDYVCDLARKSPRCPILDLELSFIRGRGVPHDDSASIDRIVPELGYVEGNVCVLSHRANSAKCRLSLEEIFVLAEWATEQKQRMAQAR